MTNFAITIVSDPVCPWVSKRINITHAFPFPPNS